MSGKPVRMRGTIKRMPTDKTARSLKNSLNCADPNRTIFTNFQYLRNVRNADYLKAIAHITYKLTLKSKKMSTSEKTILDSVLADMPNFFSSNQFSKLAQKRGIDKYRIEMGIIVNYLNQNAIRVSRRRWKKNVTGFTDVKKITTDIIEKSQEQILQEQIRNVKAHGYRVMKKVTEWVEC